MSVVIVVFIFAFMEGKFLFFLLLFFITIFAFLVHHNKIQRASTWFKQQLLYLNILICVQIIRCP